MMDYVPPTEDFLRSIDVHLILPQQDPFIMIDTLTAFSMESSTTETGIRESNIFVDGGRLSAPGIMENIAQTCAARIGFYNRFILHNDVQVGVIGAVRDFIVHSLPKVGSVITTKVDVLEEVFGMTLAKASVSCGGESVAEAEIKLAVRNSQEQ